MGNGENTLFWVDTWLGEVALKTQYPRLYALYLCKEISVAEKMSDASNLSFHRQPRRGVEKEQFRDLSSRLSEVILHQMIDRWVWTLDSSVEFSVKLVHNLIDDTLLPKS